MSTESRKRVWRKIVVLLYWRNSARDESWGEKRRDEGDTEKEGEKSAAAAPAAAAAVAILKL